MIDSVNTQQIQERLSTQTEQEDMQQEVVRPCTWQKPKADHPWRKYRNAHVEVELEVEVETRHIIPVKQYLTQLLDSWDKVEVLLDNAPGYRKHYLTELPQSKIAAYIAGVLKKYYVQKQKDNF